MWNTCSELGTSGPASLGIGGSDIFVCFVLLFGHGPLDAASYGWTRHAASVSGSVWHRLASFASLSLL